MPRLKREILPTSSASRLPNSPAPIPYTTPALPALTPPAAFEPDAPEAPEEVVVGDAAVPVSWIEENAAAALAAAGGDYEAAARATAANGRPVWECYVADLDPADPDADLVAGIEMVGGKPVVSIQKGESPNRTYTIQGAPVPGGPWGEVTEDSHFFRIKASLPE